MSKESLTSKEASLLYIYMGKGKQAPPVRAVVNTCWKLRDKGPTPVAVGYPSGFEAYDEAKLRGVNIRKTRRGDVVPLYLARDIEDLLHLSPGVIKSWWKVACDYDPRVLHEAIESDTLVPDIQALLGGKSRPFLIAGPFLYFFLASQCRWKREALPKATSLKLILEEQDWPVIPNTPLAEDLSDLFLEEPLTKDIPEPVPMPMPLTHDPQATLIQRINELERVIQAAKEEQEELLQEKAASEAARLAFLSKARLVLEQCDAHDKHTTFSCVVVEYPDGNRVNYYKE